jgi:hypothetical protein
MATQDDVLRALIRLIPPARALKEDLEKSLHLEIYAGTGDLAIRSLNGLQASAAAITSDPFIASLALTPPESSGDKEKVSMALLAAGQLSAYLEGQTGLVGMGGSGKGGNNYHTAPSINLNNIEGISAATLDKIVDTLATKQAD